MRLLYVALLIEGSCSNNIASIIQNVANVRVYISLTFPKSTMYENALNS